MSLEELEASVIARPGMYFGSLNERRLNEIIFPHYGSCVEDSMNSR